MTIETEYNSNLAVIKRLNDLLDDCNIYSRETTINGLSIHYLRAWKGTLIKVYLEIPKKTDKEKLPIEKLFMKLKDKKCNGLIKRIRTEEGPRPVIDKRIYYNRMNILFQIENECRMLADTKGMLMTTKTQVDDSPDDWGE